MVTKAPTKIFNLFNAFLIKTENSELRLTNSKSVDNSIFVHFFYFENEVSMKNVQYFRYTHDFAITFTTTPNDATRSYK